jgi:hypothetical protein
MNVERVVGKTSKNLKRRFELLEEVNKVIDASEYCGVLDFACLVNSFKLPKFLYSEYSFGKVIARIQS